MPLSDVTIHSKMNKLATNLEDQDIQKVSKLLFSIQVSEPTDITNKTSIMPKILLDGVSVNTQLD